MFLIHPLRALRGIRRRSRDERGAILAIVAVGLIIILAFCGLALDSGRAYVTRARLVRALDAGALTGARTLRSGQNIAQAQAFAVAKANGYENGVDGVALGIQFGANAEGEQTVTMSATEPMPTVLMRILGLDQFTIAAHPPGRGRSAGGSRARDRPVRLARPGGCMG